MKDRIIAAFAKIGLKPISRNYLRFEGSQVVGCCAMSAMYIAESDIPVSEITWDTRNDVMKWAKEVKLPVSMIILIWDRTGVYFNPTDLQKEIREARKELLHV